jgi:CheY-like chemotaxis protein
MSSAGSILWIDNDPAYLLPLQMTLEDEGYEVTIVGTVSHATKLLADGNYNLVILDVMMPINAEDEAEGYSTELTSQGFKTGLAFYIRNRDLLLARRLPVIVMTVRLDSAIAGEFVAAGLSERCFVTKFEMRHPKTFIEKIRSAIVGVSKET